MPNLGRKVNENEARQFGRKVANASVYYGRKAGDIAERVGPVISVIGAGTGNPALVAAGAGTAMAGKAVSNLLRRN